MKIEFNPNQKSLAWLVCTAILLSPMLFTSPTAAQTRDETINEIVALAGKTENKKPQKDKITKATETSADGKTRYVIEKHDGTKNIDKITNIGLNDDLIWPGNLIKGEQISDFVYVPISVERGPVTISISAEGSSKTGSTIKETISNPNLSNMRQGIADLLKKGIGPDTKLPARAEFEVERVYSENQMNVEIGAAVSYGVGSLNTGFDWKSTKKLNRIVAKYEQIYFTVDVNTPRSAAEFFGPASSVEVIRKAMPGGSNPLYVSSVSYGMMALMFMESSYSSEEMEAAINAAYKGAVDVKVNAKTSAKDVIRNSKLKILVYGGSTEGLGSVEMGFEGFMKVVKASKTYSPNSPGVPISYKFRNLQDNTLTFVALTNQYALRKPIRLEQKVKITVENVICTMSDDEGSNNDADMDRFSVSVTPVQKTRDGQNVKGLAAQSVWNWSTKGEKTVPSGYFWPVNKSTIVTFNTDPDVNRFDESTKLILSTYAREYDSTGRNEDGSNSLTLTDVKTFAGEKKFTVSSQDFAFDINVTIKFLD